ncbi:MAG: hypothetical protein A3K50_08495 [Planctomycetes bacterium RIFOXYD12_FULL_42_12]|nr:MAG: hypothetical protein A3K50_08495 [Planctomycetes bacterium RIFOXYD12_FULL_42_12]
MWNQATQTENTASSDMLITEIAREINNSLSEITGYTQSLLKEAAEKNKHALAKIQAHTDRARSFIRQLLDFVK